MNTITHKVISIKGEVYKTASGRYWCVDVEADSWGNVQPTTIYCSSEEEAKDIKIGYTWEA